MPKSEQQKATVPASIEEAILNELQKMITQSSIGMKFEEMEHPSEVIPDELFVGDLQDASNTQRLREIGVTHVLNCADWVPFDAQITGDHSQDCSSNEMITHTLQECSDQKDYPILDVHFNESLRFIDGALSSDQSSRVLIHCVAGMNRSVSIAVAYLIHRHGLTLETAVARISPLRPWILSNIGFQKQLIHFAWERDRLGFQHLFDHLPQLSSKL